MTDVLMYVLTIVFFAAALLYAAACGKLR